MGLHPQELLRRITPVVAHLLGTTEPEIVPLNREASARHYWRLQSNENSVILMELGSDPYRCEEICDQVPQWDELPFVSVQRFLAQGNVSVPEIYHVDEQNGILLLEDAGDITLEKAVNETSLDDREHLYQTALRELIKAQRYADHRRSLDPSFHWQLNSKILYRELEDFYRWYVHDLSDRSLSHSEQQTLYSLFEIIVDELTASPQGWCHRDFQSRNIMVRAVSEETPQVVLLDFQDAIRGPLVYDLVSLLCDSYIQIDSSCLTRLIDYYFDHSETGLDKEKFLRLCWLQTIQRKLKDAGRFVYIDRVKGNPDFLQYLPHTMTYVVTASKQLSDLQRAGQIFEQLARTT